MDYAYYNEGAGATTQVPHEYVQPKQMSPELFWGIIAIVVLVVIVLFGGSNGKS